MTDPKQGGHPLGPRGEIRRILVVAGYDWQAQAWINDQSTGIQRVAMYATGEPCVVANNPETTRYVEVGIPTYRVHSWNAMAAIEERGIRKLEAADTRDDA